MSENDSNIDRWEHVGRKLAADECFGRRCDVEDEIRSLESTLREGDDIEPGDIEDARRAMNALRRLVEHQLAPLAGVEPWSSLPPDMPYGVAREHYHIGACDIESSAAAGDD